MMTGGRGGAYEIMTSSIMEVFCSGIQKRSLKVNCSMPRRLSISDSNCAWNSFQKERHIVYVVEKKYMLNEGTMGVFLELMTHDDRGESKIAKMEVT